MTERTGHAIVVLDGAAPERDALDAAWPGWDDGATLVVAADGGARTAERLDLRIDVVVGDGDSLGDADLERLAASGVAVVRAPSAKDETDGELAIVEAVRRGATRVTVVGGLGGERPDQELANVLLLADPALVGVEAVLVDPRARVALVDASDGPAERSLDGRPGGVVSLLPLGGSVDGVTTTGLAFPLRDEPLIFGRTRGVSNVRDGERASVRVRSGRLLVVEAPVTLGR